MFRKFFSYFLIFSLALLSQAPEEKEFCDTLLNHEQITFELFSPNKPEVPAEDYEATITIAVTAHIVRNSKGEGGLSEAAVLNAVENMNEKYASTKLQFEVCTFNYIDKNRFHYFNKSDEAALIKNNAENTINLYFVNKIFSPEEGSICGYTYYPTKNQNHIILSNNCLANTTTLPHEMGHFFGLYHTHESKFGVELANGSNCSSSGDLICDTSADPGLRFSNVNENCEYVGLGFDPVKVVYNPPVSNIMSYSRKGCRKSFTEEQAMKMRENYHIFKKALKVLNTSFEYSEPYLVKGQSLYLKASGGVKYEWNTGDSTELVRVTPDSTTTYSVNIYTEDGCKVHKKYMAQVITEDIFEAPGIVCKNTPATIAVNHTSENLTYRLLNGQEEIGEEMDGNDGTLMFETTELKKNSEFSLKVTNKATKKSFVLNKKINIGITELPDTAKLKVVYADTVCKGARPYVKVVRPVKDVYYQLYYKGIALHKPMRGNGRDTLFLPAPSIEKAASFDLRVFNDCNNMFKNTVATITPNEGSRQFFSMKPEKVVVDQGTETRIKIFPTDKTLKYDLIRNNEVLVAGIPGNGGGLAIKTGELKEQSDFCLRITDKFGCSYYVEKSVHVDVNVDPQFLITYDNEGNPVFNYKLSAENDIKLEVFGMRGTRITALVNKPQRPGLYELKFADSGIFLSPNNYMIKLTVGDRKPEFKMFTIFKIPGRYTPEIPFVKGDLQAGKNILIP
jgi:hypothetical protein